MGELHGEISTDVTPAQLWAVATDWAGQGRWIPLTSARLVGDGPSARGSTVEAWTGIGRIGFVDVMTIEVWEPPTRLDLRHVGRVVRGTAGFVIEPLGGRGSRILWWERIDLPFGALGRLAWPLVAPALRWSLHRTLRALAAVASAAPAR